jgi:hypothetical protein
MAFIDLVAFVAGLATVFLAFGSSIRIFMLPGERHHPLARLVFRGTQTVFLLLGRLAPAGRDRSNLYGLFGPTALLAVYATVILLMGVGFAAMFWAIEDGTALERLESAYVDSGSALSTLGFANLDDFRPTSLSVIEALLTTTVSALLIGYLPVIFSTYLHTAQAVADLESETGGARGGAEVLLAMQAVDGEPGAAAPWKAWTTWFGRLGASHGSLVGNLFLRSPEPHRSWVQAAGSVLDAAALDLTVIDGRPSAAVRRCLDTGIAALDRAVHFLGFDSGRMPDDAPGVSRADFETACDQLADGGITVVPDRDAAWQAFMALRARYDRQLRTLARVKDSPCHTLACGAPEAQAPLRLPVLAGKPLHDTDAA